MSSDIVRFILGGSTILLIFANSIGQSQYDQAVSNDISFTSNNFLCWFTQIWLIICFPLALILHFLFLLARCNLEKLRNQEQEVQNAKFNNLTALHNYISHIKGKLKENPLFSW